jgi:lipopolysaccharide/colanic/teichoic acid biosynthesis glycosyltransferase
MEQGTGLYIEQAVREKEADSISIDGRESDVRYYSTVLLEPPFEKEQHLVKPIAIPSVHLPSVPAYSEYMVRALDIAGSALLLLLAAPVMVFVALLVKLSSRGPVLYKQRRVGECGRFFTLYKFRTMVDNAEKHTGPVWATRDDNRVTPVGKVLRCTRLDELPQLFNVLKGDMSLVGPRPERPFFVRQHKSLQGVRLAVKPGITGLAQVRSYYDLKPDHKLKYDFLYIRRRSLMLNLYILLQTVPVLFLKRGW